MSEAERSTPGSVSYLVASPLVTEASSVARFLLRGMPQRLAHVEAAGRQAVEVARRLPGELDGEAVIAAALLHDIGYSSDIRRTGFHPLDGALFLAETDWPDTVVRLVAHHSHAAVVAPYHGVDHHLALIAPVEGFAADVLTYADLTAGRKGKGSTPEDRVAEMAQRHAKRKDVPIEVREERYALLLGSSARVRDALLGVPSLDSRRRRGVEAAAS